MTLPALIRQAAQRGLRLIGGFHPEPDDNLPVAWRTIVLLGPDGPHFWAQFCASPESLDGRPNPMDRWSERVIGNWARALDAQALLPFGTPTHPFYDWALRTGRCHASPIAFLVHDDAGLLVSFRGALALPDQVGLTAQRSPSPCLSCATQPCRVACPVDALTAGGYDVGACKTHLRSTEGQDCMSNGCAARRACPISQGYPRLSAQSAFHMRSFIAA